MSTTHDEVPPAGAAVLRRWLAGRAGADPVMVRCYHHCLIPAAPAARSPAIVSPGAISSRRPPRCPPLTGRRYDFSVTLRRDILVYCVPAGAVRSTGDRRSSADGWQRSQRPALLAARVGWCPQPAAFLGERAVQSAYEESVLRTPSSDQPTAFAWALTCEQHRHLLEAFL